MHNNKREVTFTGAVFMNVEDGGAYLGLLSFLAFAFSIIAAVTAIDTYRLLRSGDAGKPWRILIISSVVFALVQVMFIVELLIPNMWLAGLSQVGQLMFALTLAYAFYLQRRLFSEAASLRRHDESHPEEGRPSGFKRQRLLLDQATEPDTTIPQQIKTESVAQTSVAQANAINADSSAATLAENAVQSVSAYDTDDDIEWSQVKAVSR
jgi:hypothetical protein